MARQTIAGKTGKLTLLLIFACPVLLTVEFCSYLIQQLCQPAIRRRHHPAMGVIHGDHGSSNFLSVLDSIRRINSEPAVFEGISTQWR